MGLLSKKDAKLITDPLADNNPITIQVLGICSALAITAELKASLVMGIAVLFVLGIGNVVISLMRNIIPSKIIAPIKLKNTNPFSLRYSGIAIGSIKSVKNK